MRRRYLRNTLETFCFEHHKIALVSGPRQCGKTTLARQMLAQRGAGAYHNWDQVEFRRRWTIEPQSTVEVNRRGRVPLVVFDEVHKARLWKRTLKGIYDTLEKPVDLFVTGSARLAVYRKGSDSLLGRYRRFRLHPFSVGELVTLEPPTPEVAFERLLERRRRSRSASRWLDQLIEFGPFPEPLLAADERRARVWRRERLDAVVREDLRDLSRIAELDRVQMLAALLPERAGSLLSVQSLRRDLEVSHDTARRWLTALSDLYYSYEIKPYSRRIRRSLRKEGVLYLWDWSEVADPGRRFENLVAGHLLKACHFWTDAGYGSFTLCFVRNRDGRELDFVVVRDGEPWLPVEVKLTDTSPAPAWKTFLPFLRTPWALQVVREPGVREEHVVDDTRLLVVSADQALAALV